MKIIEFYLTSIDYDLWGVIKKGYEDQKKEDGQPLLDEEWTSVHKKAYSINVRSVNLFHYALNLAKFNRISTCRMTKKIWKDLKLTYEGTN